MKVNFDKVMLDIDGSKALEQRLKRDAKTGEPSEPPQRELVPLTMASAIMQALNAQDAPVGEKMERYRIIVKVRENPAEVDLEQKEPERIRAAVEHFWPPFIYGQVCETLGL